MISCNSCGIVLDKDRLTFPDVYDHDSGDVIDEQAMWNGDSQEFVSYIDCPVCGNAVKEKNN